jgi:hypothetical protein
VADHTSNKSIETIVLESGAHPFATNVNNDNIETVLSHYLGMSVAFPYLQAGAIGRVFERVLRSNEDVDVAIEATSAVASFLVWDEFGGHAKILADGVRALPSILETRSFHANLLRGDIRHLFGKELKPSFAEPTGTYLQALYDGLASDDVLDRAAHMVAFERHAGIMIDALWSSLGHAKSVPPESLSYFYTHVGGDDPAEAYHIEMTGKMLSKVVCAAEWAGFLRSFELAYKLNFEWCRDITLIN